LETRIVFRGQWIGPDKARGINIGVQAALKPVQLIGSDEVHLARQHRFVSRIRQVVRKGRDKAVVGIAVVIASGRGCIEPGHEARTRRHADRTGGVSIGEVS